jgi:hypothetical protein
LSTAIDALLATAKDAFVTVGDGRGFLVEVRRSRLVITAAHCLPHLPLPHPGSYTEERTYPQLLGPLGVAPVVSAQCLFADPIADLAVLCQPDSQAFVDEAITFEDLVENRPALQIGALTEPGPGWLMTLGGQWVRCTLDVGGSSGGWLSSLLIADAPEEAVAPGTSGSPILDVDGRAVGVISVGEMFNPPLAPSLPGWLLAHLTGHV